VYCSYCESFEVAKSAAASGVYYWRKPDMAHVFWSRPFHAVAVRYNFIPCEVEEEQCTCIAASLHRSIAVSRWGVCSLRACYRNDLSAVDNINQNVSRWKQLSLSRNTVLRKTAIVADPIAKVMARAAVCVELIHRVAMFEGRLGD
jgi:hypothetical protein